jgi:hypothetical protein
MPVSRGLNLSLLRNCYSILDSSGKPSLEQQGVPSRGGALASEHSDVNAIGVARKAAQYHGKPAEEHVASGERAEGTLQVAKRVSERSGCHLASCLRSSSQRK